MLGQKVAPSALSFQRTRPLALSWSNVAGPGFRSISRAFESCFNSDLNLWFQDASRSHSKALKLHVLCQFPQTPEASRLDFLSFFHRYLAAVMNSEKASHQTRTVEYCETSTPSGTFRRNPSKLLTSPINRASDLIGRNSSSCSTNPSTR